jgi:Dyp-type peroxidase family
MSKLNKQSGLTVIAPIKAGCTGKVANLLDQIRNHTHCNGLVNFGEMSSIHFAAMLILPATREKCPNRLLLETNYDGPLDRHLDELIQHAPRLDELFGYCEDYPSDVASSSAAVKDYLIANSVPSSAFHVAFPQRTVADIKDAIEVSLAARSEKQRIIELAAQGLSNVSPAPGSLNDEQVRTILASHFRTSETPRPPMNSPTNSETLRIWSAIQTALLCGIVLVALIVAIRMVIYMPAASAWVLLILAAAIVADRELADDAASNQLPQVKEEDSGVDPRQNHMCTLTPVKPGYAPLIKLKLLLWLVNLCCRWIFIRGKLGPIATIHFARWTLVDNNRALMFLSNYDGAWFNYLGDFADQGWGVTAIWSNTVGFPRSKFIFWGGARNVLPFEDHVRRHLVATNVFYSAYSGETVQAIRRFLDDRDALARRIGALDEVAASSERVRVARADVQGIVGSGYNYLNHARFLLLRIKDKDSARRWLHDIVIPHVSNAVHLNSSERQQQPHHLNIAFTYRGLQQLGIAVAVENFSEEFRFGMTRPAAQQLLGDLDDDARGKWDFGTEANPLDILLMLYGRCQTDLNCLVNNVCCDKLDSCGLELVCSQDSVREPGDTREPFGFRDGISQPAVVGLVNRPPLNKDELISTGEFLLGYENEYGQLTPVPSIAREHDPNDLLLSPAGCPKDRKLFGYNGSYLVVRKLEQNVSAFNDFIAEQARNTDGSANHYRGELVAARMVGRWRSGAPLTLAPHCDIPALGAHRAISNNFRYRPLDRNGAACPVGAHIRRANPRDSLDFAARRSLALSKRHRIIRRGRPYREGSEKQGTFFIAMNADLRRQFEFVQQAWVNNPQFMGYNDGPDRIAGVNHDMASRGLHESVGCCPRGLASFVTVKGGAYFFLPSIPALKIIASFGRMRSSGSASASVQGETD